METLSVIDQSVATGAIKGVFDQVTAIMGRVPRMMQLMGHSAAAAQAYVSLNSSLAQATLPASTRALVAVVVVAADDCDYSRLIARGQARRSDVVQAQIDAAVRVDSANQGRSGTALRAAARGVPRPALAAGGREAQGGWSTARGKWLRSSPASCSASSRNYFNLVAGTALDGPPAPTAREASGSRRVVVSLG